MREDEMGQEKCPLAWRPRAWCAGHELLLPEDWYRSLGPQHGLFAANLSQSRSRQLLEKAFDEGVLFSN